MEMVCFRNEFQSVQNGRAPHWVENKGMFISKVFYWSLLDRKTKKLIWDGECEI
jgi:hypothetical protein